MSATQSPHPRDRLLLQQALQCLRDDRLPDAAAACDALLAARPDLAEAWDVASHVRQRMRDFDGMLSAAERAAAISPQHAGRELRRVECLIYCGRTVAAIKRLRELERASPADPGQQLRVGNYYTHCGLHTDAFECFRRAATLDPSDRHARASLAAAATTLGRLDEAGELLRQAVEERPGDYDAWVSLANLRTWTAQANHVASLRALLQRLEDPAGEAPLCYALSKELDDIGEAGQAFDWLMRGANARRQAMRYRVERDVEVIDAIIDAFPASKLAATRSEERGSDAVFVMGLPRTGTTLVDRILSSHPAVESLGELRDFTFAVMRACGPGEPGQLPLVRRSAGIDFAALGRGYLEAVEGYRHGRPRFVDKTPANYLYAGLIRLALPGARLVMMRRNPMDACYAMLRTLFQAGYPFSYALEDLGHYYVAWHRLVTHWQEAMPGIVLEVWYERLVQEQEVQTRRLLEHCGLPWDDACMAFHANPAPSATASAVQVRRPLYRSSVARWEQHARALEPLVSILREGGVTLG